jgi:hypothetical protein
MPTRPDGHGAARPAAPAAPRLPGRLRMRRALVVPPLKGSARD